jgi:alanine dehydrogenase
MPGAVPKTSTLALTNATLPFALEIADRGLRHAVKAEPALAKGVNIFQGNVTNRAVAGALGLQYRPLGLTIEY